MIARIQKVVLKEEHETPSCQNREEVKAVPSEASCPDFNLNNFC